VSSNGVGKAELVPGSTVPNSFLSGSPIDLSPDGKFLAYSVNVLDPDDPKVAVRKTALLDLSSSASPRFLKEESTNFAWVAIHTRRKVRGLRNS
jgi:hypothetical protein